MPALKTERRIYMWRIVPRPVPKESDKTVTLAEVTSALKYEFDQKRADIYIGDDGAVLESGVSVGFQNKNRMYLADIDDTKDTVVLLINRGDPNVVDPSFISDGKEVREVKPNPDEVPGASAHLVISKSKQSDGSHRACFEYVPHVSSTLTERLLGDMLTRFAKDNHLKYTYQKTTKGKKGALKKENHPYRPVINVDRVPSESILEDIQRGEVSGVTLIDTKYHYTGADSIKIERNAVRKLSLKLLTTEQKSVGDLIENIMTWGKQEKYTSIQFETENEGKKHPKFPIDIQDAKEMLYSKSRTITGFSEELKSCYPEIAETIVTRLTKFISDDKEWA